MGTWPDTVVTLVRWTELPQAEQRAARNSSGEEHSGHFMELRNRRKTLQQPDRFFSPHLTGSSICASGASRKRDGLIAQATGSCHLHPPASTFPEEPCFMKLRELGLDDDEHRIQESVASVRCRMPPYSRIFRLSSSSQPNTRTTLEVSRLASCGSRLIASIRLPSGCGS